MAQFTRAEVEAIFRRAAELEQAAVIEAPSELLTADEVIAAGVEAGLSEPTMRRVVQESQALAPVTSRALSVALPAAGGVVHRRLEAAAPRSVAEISDRFERFMRDTASATSVNGDPRHFRIEADGADVRLVLVERGDHCEVAIELAIETPPKLTWGRGLKGAGAAAGIVGLLSIGGAIGGGAPVGGALLASSAMATIVLLLAIPLIAFTKSGPDFRGLQIEVIERRFEGFLSSLAAGESTASRALPAG